VGTWGPGAFDNDDALDLLDTLTGQDAASRRETLERLFRTTREHPENLNWTLGPGRVVAAAAVVPVGLPVGQTGSQRRQMMRDAGRHSQTISAASRHFARQ
jgi:Domain of unknown function (DUF4259)